MLRAFRIVAALAVVSALSSTLHATEFYGVSLDGLSLYRIDDSTFTATKIGDFTMPNPFSEPGIFALALGDGGELFGMTAGQFSGTLYRIDTTNAALTEITPLFAPTGPAACGFDPVTKEIWWINYGGFVFTPYLQHVDPATSVVTHVGGVGPFGTPFNGGGIDTLGNFYGFEVNSQSLWIVDKTTPNGPGTHPIGSGFGAHMDVSWGACGTGLGHTGSLLAYTVQNHAFFGIDVNTGDATLLKSLDGTFPQLAAIAGPQCKGEVLHYGTACAGSGGFAPDLHLSGCPVPGEFLDYQLSLALGGANALILFGTAQASVPVGGGCHLYVGGILPSFLVVPVPGNGPGNGFFSLHAQLPLMPPGTLFTSQIFVADPANPLHYTATNGLQVITG